MDNFFKSTINTVAICILIYSHEIRLMLSVLFSIVVVWFGISLWASSFWPFSMPIGLLGLLLGSVAVESWNQRS